MRNADSFAYCGEAFVGNFLKLLWKNQVSEYEEYATLN